MRVRSGNPRDARLVLSGIPRVLAFYPHPSSLISLPGGYGFVVLICSASLIAE